MSKIIAESLSSADKLVDNSLLSDEIKAAVEKKKYTEEKLQAGKALVTGSRTAVENQKLAEGAALTSTKNEEAAKAEAHRQYQDLAKTARSIFPAKSPQLVKLGLVGDEPKSTDDFIKAGYILFDNASTDTGIFNAFAEKGYTKESLADGRAAIQAYESANKAQAAALSAAKNTTKLQAQALKAMNKWVGEYKIAAKIALRDREDLLNSIGITIPKHTGRKKKSANTAAKTTSSTNQ